MPWYDGLPECRSEQFSLAAVEEVLYEFDGPRIFTTKCAGLLYFWYECDEDYENNIRKFLVVPADQGLVLKLKSGSKTVHDALNQPWLWLVDIDEDDVPKKAWVVPGINMVPIEAKPDKSAFLWPELQPLLSYRLIGSDLSEGHVPASVVARAVEQPTLALKRLFELLGNIGNHGKPHEALRKAYDLPARHFAFNSFEVSFGLPFDTDLFRGDQSQKILDAISLELTKAFDWLDSESFENLPIIELLEILKDLSPPSHGVVEKAELRGLLVRRDEPVVLTRNDRKTVSSAIKRLRQFERPVMYIEGRIGGFDKDNLTFILRDWNGGKDLEVGEDLICSFEETQYDYLWDAFEGNSRVRVFVRQPVTGKRLQVVAAAPTLEISEIKEFMLPLLQYKRSEI